MRTRTRHPLAKKFTDIAVVDSTVMELADVLKRTFKGAGGSIASLKVTLMISVFGLVPLHAGVTAGKDHDQTLFPPLDILRRGALLLFDKGFVAYERIGKIHAAGHYYLCPMRLNGNALVVAAHQAPAYVRAALRRHPEGVKLRTLLPKKTRIAKAWDLDVVVASHGQMHHVPSRLVLVPGPKQAQRPYLTNLNRQQWTPATLVELYRLRWQVELVFKELKQHLNLESLHSRDPNAVQVLAWASLIALAVSRTVTAWVYPQGAIVGLSSTFRPALTSRALRATVRFLGRALVAPSRRALAYLRDFAEELLIEIRSRDRSRRDSFVRLEALMAPP